MSRTIIKSIKKVIGIALSLAAVSCSGFHFDGGDINAAVEYPVNITADSNADTRIAVDELALSWEQTDTMKITAVAADGTYGVSELTIYQIDENNASSASFSGFVSLLAPPQECYFLYPNSSATSYNPSTGRVKIQYNAQTGRHEPIMYAKTAYNQDGNLQWFATAEPCRL